MQRWNYTSLCPTLYMMCACVIICVCVVVVVALITLDLNYCFESALPSGLWDTECWLLVLSIENGQMPIPKRYSGKKKKNLCFLSSWKEEWRTYTLTVQIYLYFSILCVCWGCINTHKTNAKFTQNKKAKTELIKNDKELTCFFFFFLSDVCVFFFCFVS